MASELEREKIMWLNIAPRIVFYEYLLWYIYYCYTFYRGTDMSLAAPGKKQANVSARMAWMSFGALPCRKKETWWQLASRCCWNRARPWHASELVSFLVELRTYQHLGVYVVTSIYIYSYINIRLVVSWFISNSGKAASYIWFPTFRESKLVLIQRWNH